MGAQAAGPRARNTSNQQQLERRKEKLQEGSNSLSRHDASRDLNTHIPRKKGIEGPNAGAVTLPFQRQNRTWARSQRTRRTSPPLRPSTRAPGSKRSGARRAAAGRQASRPWASRLGSLLGPSPKGSRRSLACRRGGCRSLGPCRKEDPTLPWVRASELARSPTPPPPTSPRGERVPSAGTARQQSGGRGFHLFRRTGFLSGLCSPRRRATVPLAGSLAD